MLKNKTILNKDKHMTFTHFIFKKRIIPMIIAIELLALTLLILSFMIKGDIMIKLTIFFFMITYPIGMILSQKLTDKKIIKSFLGLDEGIKIDYEFRDDDFDVFSKSNNIDSHSKAEYRMLLKVQEDKENIYLFVNTTNALIIDKNSFTEGTLDDFRKILSNKIDKKGKIIKKITI
jgi:hypothetical protein